MRALLGDEGGARGAGRWATAGGGGDDGRPPAPLPRYARILIFDFKFAPSNAGGDTASPPSPPRSRWWRCAPSDMAPTAARASAAAAAAAAVGVPLYFGPVRLARAAPRNGSDGSARGDEVTELGGVKHLVHVTHVVDNGDDDSGDDGPAGGDGGRRTTVNFSAVRCLVLIRQRAARYLPGIARKYHHVVVLSSGRSARAAAAEGAARAGSQKEQ